MWGVWCVWGSVGRVGSVVRVYSYLVYIQPQVQLQDSSL